MCVRVYFRQPPVNDIKGEGGACVYMRRARKAFYSNTIYCEESEKLTQSEMEGEGGQWQQQTGTHTEMKTKC